MKTTRRGAAGAGMVLVLLLAGASTAEGQVASWTSDRHTLRVGDLVTVLVNESTLASANRTDSRVQNRSRDLGLDAGTGSSSVSGGLRSRADLGDQMRGESSRRDRFVTEVSARVVEEDESGALRLEGVKQLQIDGHEQTLSIAGWFRSADLSGANTLESWRLADAEIRYGSQGDLGRVRGVWGRLFGWLWP